MYNAPFWMKRWGARLGRQDRTAKWLAVLFVVSLPLHPLGCLLYFMSGGREPLFIKVPLMLIGSLAFVATIYFMIVAVIRQMGRNVTAGRPFDEDDVNDRKKGYLVHIFLTGLAVTSMCLCFGYHIFDRMFNLHLPEFIGKGLFFIMLGFLFLFGAYVYVIDPIFSLFNALSRPRKRENGVKYRNHAEAETEVRILKPQGASAVAEPADFNDLLVAILAEIAREGRRFSLAEQALILDFLKRKVGHDEARLARDKGLVKRALDQPGDIERLLAILAARYPYPARLTTVYLIFQFAHSKNPPLAAELRLARNIAAALEIRPDDLRNIEAAYRSSRNKFGR